MIPDTNLVIFDTQYLPDGHGGYDIVYHIEFLVEGVGLLRTQPENKAKVWACYQLFLDSGYEERYFPKTGGLQLRRNSDVEWIVIGDQAP